MKSAKATKREVIKKPESIKTPEPIQQPEAGEKGEPGVRVVKTATCPSLSGKSTLTYEVGCTESNELRLRIVANTNAGAFCTDWTELKSIRAALDRAPKHETVTSDLLVPLFRERSANMPGFLWSLLLHEGLVRRSAKEKRRYERVEPEAFEAAVKSLAEGKGAPAVADAKGRKAKGKKVVPEKTPSASRKKPDRPS